MHKLKHVLTWHCSWDLQCLYQKVVKICETVERTFIFCGPSASEIIEMTCHWRNWILLLLLGLSKHVRMKLPWKYQGEGLCKLLLIWEWTLSQVLTVGLTGVGVDTTPEP
jgi:hypothetical protein